MESFHPQRAPQSLMEPALCLAFLNKYLPVYLLTGPEITLSLPHVKNLSGRVEVHSLSWRPPGILYGDERILFQNIACSWGAYTVVALMLKTLTPLVFWIPETCARLGRNLLSSTLTAPSSARAGT